MQQLKQKLILHLCNKGTPDISDWESIISKEYIKSGEFDTKEIAWLVNVHLNWKGKNFMENYGFDIANLIRTEVKSKAPIILYSPVKLSFFEKKSEAEIKYKILFGRGTSFIESPFNETDLTQLIESIQPMSNATLHDVATMLCDLKGIVIDKLNHDLKFDSNIKSVIASIRPYLSSFQSQLINLEQFSEKLVNRIEANDRIGFFSDKQQFITLCNLQLTDLVKLETETKKAKHKILVIDDKDDELKSIESNLSSDFELIEVNQAYKAIEVLNKDISNTIVAIVSDWRLYSDERQTYWQDLQGYEILDFASKNGVRALFALTSQADFVVHHIRNLMGVRFSMFKKENLQTAEQWKVFSEVLNESCEQVVQLRASLPEDSAQWTKIILKNGTPLKTLKQQYIEIWNSQDRDTFFSQISSTADNIWNYLEFTPNNNPLTLEFGITVPTKILELEPILIYRRIWYALWFNKTELGRRLSKDTISKYSEEIYKKMFAPGNKREMHNSATQNAYKLCIEINKVQQGGFLPEEKEWLINHKLLSH